MQGSIRITVAPFTRGVEAARVMFLCVVPPPDTRASQLYEP
jgi:hypothetical protein